ncbi:MAG: oligosaccharide flippase family protein [Coriobacteriales bacterium]|nr:oligosaccharide flippase family protein [Coriobacteriales bacterium]
MVRAGSVSRNALLIGLATACNYAFSFLTVFYAARVLQPEAMGSVAFAAAVVSYFSLLAKLGTPLYGMRSVAAARGGGGLARLTGELFWLGVLLALGAAALLACSVWVVPRLAESWPLYAVLGVGLVLDGLSCDWLYKGLERYRFLLVRDLAVRLIVFALLLALVHDAGELLWYAALSALSTAGCAVVGLAFVSRTLRAEGALAAGGRAGWLACGRGGLRKHLRPTLTFFLMSCATLIYANLDVVMLGFMGTPAEVGYYQVAAKAKVGLVAVSGIVWNAALPQATMLWERGSRDEFQRLASHTMGIVCAVQAVVTVACLALAESAMILAAGEEYVPAVPAFRVLVLCVLPVAVSNILGGQVLIPAGRERWLLACEVCGAVANLALNFALIPSLGGVGAAVSTVVAEVIVALGTYACVRAGLRLKLFPWDAWAGGVAVGLLRRVRHAWYAARFGRGRDGMGYCPCCETPVPRWAAGRFLEQPQRFDRRRYEHMRQDVLCPVCGALPRHRILAWYLSQHPELVRGRRVLYFAPEASMAWWLRRHGVGFVTADLYAPADLRVDIQDTEMGAGSWDVVVCNHVLEHVDDWRRALAEVRRVLASGGVLICSFPIDPSYATVVEDASVTTAEARVERFGQDDHLRVFGRDSAELLEAAGFEVEVVRGDDLPGRMLPVVGPANYDAAEVFVCRRAV